ncbi:ATP-grasp domain-containing protein [Streptomyces kanamyceticus]|uniref:ATP-grasp domain-containing protein n=1 Tax=Streptomyces kanamyceticus TaxID=1967 RepID=A0A5J6G439_STRKN|nr:ATP-grasp domain-containing protein [Streptomyces kanamyceticus]
MVGSGTQEYREYLLRSAALKADLWLLDETAPTWQSPHLAGSTQVVPSDVNALVAAARSVAERRAVRGVFCYDEALILPAAQVAEALGLPGPTVTAVRNCRDKHRTRALLRDAGLPQPKFALVADLAEAAAAAEWIGYPVVVKPRGLGASRGVALVRSAADLAGLFADARSAHYPGVPTYRAGILVEEYLEGPEISVDGAVHDGEYATMFLARKEVGLSPYFEETGHLVDAGDPLLNDPALRWILARTHRALRVDHAVTHTELRLTSRGFVVIEVNGRLGGDLIPYLGKLATGIDPGLVALDVALRTPPDLTPTHARAAGIRFLYPPEHCRVDRVTVPAPDEASGLLRATALAAPGDELRLPPLDYLQRYAYVLCAADTPEGCVGRLDEAEAQVALHARPLEHVTDARRAS